MADRSEQTFVTQITDARWMAYDLPGNVGWIAYITALILALVRKPVWMEVPLMKGLILIAVIPAVMMLIGVAELISERIQKLDRILPKRRLLRGFGLLTWGGCGGTIVAAIGLVTGSVTGQQKLLLLWVMLVGGILCALFAGLIMQTFAFLAKH